MSWAEEDWTVGLSGRVLQKVKELQVHQERLSRENKQKHLQLNNINTSLEKQTVKYEEVRGELQYVQRELQSVRDEAKAAVTNSERLTQDLHTKQAQVCSLEGQIEAARTLNNKLTQEVKRLEAELEKLQNSSRLADTTLFSTPCWNTTSPWEHSGSKKEERPGQRDEGQSRAHHSRRLQFSEVGSASLPRQQHKITPHRHPSDQSETFSTPLAAFPWERDDSRPATRRASPSSPQTPCADVAGQGQPEQRVCGNEREPRTETNSSLSEAWSRVTALEEEMCVKAGKLKSIQSELVQCKKELGAKELSLQRVRDELSLAHSRMAQESERASGAEQRQKQLQEELKCQRQNAESSRLQHQQRSKELEKQHQRDLTELQKERQCLEKQHQQEVNKLNQELQQARALHNALQAQTDKLSLQKQVLDKELDTLREKLKWTEGQLQESQKKEAQTQARLMEALREAEGVALSLEQSRKRERVHEEEGRRLAKELADALHLLKELQEQKAIPTTPQPPVQFCSVGQSFSPQPSYSLHSRSSTHIKRPSVTALAEQKREEDVDKRRAEIAASYPSDREPGEGIDSEHITDLTSPDSECFQRHKEEGKSRNEAVEDDSSGINKHSDEVLSSSSHSAAGVSSSTCVDEAFKDLKRENATLRSELSEAREELQKRLEDLEAQRRAEMEAKTRLKQLSRKRASQALEKEGQDKEWKAQLESERAETEKLRKAMAALETEVKRERKEREEQREEKNKALEDHKSEMIELNIQLKKQLAEVKAQLALEREEKINTDVDLNVELEQLKAELEELKRSREVDSPEDDKLSDANSPLTYLTLHDDELNSNIFSCDNKLLPSPEQHLLFCQSTNQRNVLVSQVTADLIQETLPVIRSPLSNEGPPGGPTSDPRDDRQNPLGGASQHASSDLVVEVERLREAKTKESERANLYHVKLEALQCQVTRQTKQLTMAFEKQSQHISGLLAELQEKESALLSQGEELQRYKQALDALRAENEGEEKRRSEEMTVKEDGERKDEQCVEISGSHNECESNVQTEAGQIETVICDAEKPTPEPDNEARRSEEQHPGSQVSNESANGWTEDAELLDLKRDDQQLRQRTEGLAVSDIRNPASHADSKNHEEPKQSQNTGNAAPSCSAEQRSPDVQNDVTTDAQQSPLQDVRAEEELLSELQVSRLQQQVEELQTRLQALSADFQQQAEELVLWRLSSQPTPTFDLPPPGTDEQSGSQDRLRAIGQSQSNQQQTGKTTQSPESRLEAPSTVTVIREDELLLCCSSNKLQGSTVSSRLQHSSLPEPKSLHPSVETLQENSPTVQESEKENYEREKRDVQVRQMSSETTGQPHITKESQDVWRPKCHRDTPQASRAASEKDTSRDVRTPMRSVGSQTEDTLCPRSAPIPSELCCAYTQTEEEEEDKDEEHSVESPPISPVPSSEGTGSILFPGSFPIPADPARLAERIRRNRTQLSAAFDDTEYEPYGLPEVVMKGFADIPTGPSCPYIVRRGLLGTTVVPAAQKQLRQEEETD